MGVILGLAVFLGILGFVQGFFFDGAKERRVKKNQEELVVIAQGCFEQDAFCLSIWEQATGKPFSEKTWLADADGAAHALEE